MQTPFLCCSIGVVSWASLHDLRGLPACLLSNPQSGKEHTTDLILACHKQYASSSMTRLYSRILGALGNWLAAQQKCKMIVKITFLVCHTISSSSSLLASRFYFRRLFVRTSSHSGVPSPRQALRHRGGEMLLEQAHRGLAERRHPYATSRLAGHRY